MSAHVRRMLRWGLAVCAGLGPAAGAWAQQTTVVEYIHTDALGSPVAVTDASGNLVERDVYEPYGSPTIRSPSDRPGFTGHVADSLTNLTYMQQRYYDPQIGRFLSVDPVTAYSNPVGAFNRYWYANNNPYKFTDPDGRQSCSIGTKICMSEGALRSRIDRLNSESPKQSNNTTEGAVRSFANNARPLQQASGREISANIEERHDSDYRVVDYDYSRSSNAENEAPVTIYSGAYKWNAIIHTHPERHAYYQLSGSGAYGENGKFYSVGMTDVGDVAQAFNKNVDMYVVPPSGPSTFFGLKSWRNAVEKAGPNEIVYAGSYEKEI